MSKEVPSEDSEVEAVKEPGVEFDSKNFLEARPLYFKEELPPVENPARYKQEDLYPDMIEINCSTCGSDRPFRIHEEPITRGDRITYVHTGSSPSLPNAGDFSYSPYPLLILEYRCTGCESQMQRFWVQFDFEEEWVRKIGQCPPWSIDIPEDIRSTLGEDAALYKNARILMSQSYGIGACAYLRLLVESQIGTILELVRDVRLERDSSKDDLSEVEEALESHHFENKLDVAVEYTHDSLHLEGHNPIAMLHEQYSKCLHPPSDDDESMEVAMKLASAAEYVLRELSRQLSSSRDFKQTIREIDQG